MFEEDDDFLGPLRRYKAWLDRETIRRSPLAGPEGEAMVEGTPYSSPTDEENWRSLQATRARKELEAEDARPLWEKGARMVGEGLADTVAAPIGPLGALASLISSPVGEAEGAAIINKAALKALVHRDRAGGLSADTREALGASPFDILSIADKYPGNELQFVGNTAFLPGTTLGRPGIAGNPVILVPPVGARHGDFSLLGGKAAPASAFGHRPPAVLEDAIPELGNVKYFAIPPGTGYSGAWNTQNMLMQVDPRYADSVIPHETGHLASELLKMSDDDLLPGGAGFNSYRGVLRADKNIRALASLTEQLEAKGQKYKYMSDMVDSWRKSGIDDYLAGLRARNSGGLPKDLEFKLYEDNAEERLVEDLLPVLWKKHNAGIPASRLMRESELDFLKYLRLPTHSLSSDDLNYINNVAPQAIRSAKVNLQFL